MTVCGGCVRVCIVCVCVSACVFVHVCVGGGGGGCNISVNFKMLSMIVQSMANMFRLKQHSYHRQSK